MDNFTIFSTAISALASIAILYGLFHLTSPGNHKGYVLGFFLVFIGNAGQVYRNISYYLSGIAPIDSDLPIWLFKDIGILVVALTYLALRKKG